VANGRQTSTTSRLALAGICSLLALAAGVAPAQATTQTFLYTGVEQMFTVPGGVTSVHVVAIGGVGGDATDSVGGAAAEVSGDITVTPGQTLYVEVGGIGKDIGEGGEGGFNGGGDGGGGGGGASDVRTSPLASGLAPDHRLIVAAGGGGGGGSGPSGTGANGGAAGSAGANSELYAGGGAGTAIAGGLGAAGCFGSTGGNGTLGEGGAGGDPGESSGPGGGGGAGYYGGGGGAGSCEFGSSGGGGGSSLIPPLGLAALSSAAPKIEISYTLVPPTIEIVSPANGATYTQGQAVSAIYSCTPAGGTGVKSCIGPVANGAALDTATLGSHAFTVKAEDADTGKAEKTVNYTVVAPKSESKPEAPSVPNTVLGSHPKKKIATTKAKAKVKFTFSSDVAGATFKCKLDKGSFAACTSPKSYKVKPGRHTFSVEAVSPGGTDATPATFGFKVVKKTQ
jgi:Glycine rich protein